MFGFCKHKQIYFFLLLVLISNQANAQKISCPEKIWAVFHFCKAKKALKISMQARLVTAEFIKDSVLVGSGNGLQLDAFRHTYWMATLTQQIGAKRAYRLGKAHEKGNYKDYKKRRNEDGVVPDKISTIMDLHNNNIGIELGKTYKGDNLKQAVIDTVKKGTCKIIKMDSKGNFLDENGIVITPESLIGT